MGVRIALPTTCALLALGLLSCGGDDETACDLVSEDEVAKAVEATAGGSIAPRRSANDSLNLSVCRHTAPGVNVRLTLDTAPEVRRRYFNRVTELAQFNVHNRRQRPQPVQGIGDEDAYGPAGAYWLAGSRQLFALSGERQLIVQFAVRGVGEHDARAAAERLARLALDRPATDEPGGNDEARETPTQISIVAPNDDELVRDREVTVRGTVSGRDVAVQVGGRPAPVRGGIFAATVPLERGRNRITIVARGGGAVRRRAVTVRRGRTPEQVGAAFARSNPGKVPDVLGQKLTSAEKTLRGAGLRFRRVKLESGRLNGRDWAVCLTRPAPGARVDGERVALLVDRVDEFQPSETVCAQQ
jgi:hypothetical protein